MAYTTILTAEGSSVAGNNYRITIASDVSAATPFTEILAVPIAEITYKPETDDLAGALVPSVLNFYVHRDPGNATDLDNFIDEILEYQQDNAYLVLVEQDLGSGYSPYWRGILLQDELKQADAFIQTVTFTAVDGLAYLKNKEYADANTNTTTEPYSTPVKDVILNALQQGISTDFWGAGQDYLITSVDWWENSQSYSGLGQPLETQVFDVRAFVTISEREDGLFTQEVINCYDVLQAFARAYFARIYMAGGSYRFEQVPLRTSDSRKQNVYDKSGTRIAGGVVNVTQIIDGDVGAARLAGNTFARFPALNRVEVNLKPYASTFDDAMTLDASDYGLSSTEGFGYFDELVRNTIGNIQQQITLNFDFKCTGSWFYQTSDIVDPGGGATIGTVGIKPTCQVEIVLSDINSSDVWYWDQVNSQWTLTPTTFRANGGLKTTRQGLSVPSATITWRPNDGRTFAMTTDNLPATGTVSITLDDFKWRGMDSLTSFSDISLIGGGTYGMVESSLSGEVQMTFGTKYNRGSTVRAINIENSDTKIADNLVYTYPEIKISDGGVQTGCIMIDNGVSLEAATEWRVANESTSLALGALLAKQRLELQKEVLEQYNGQVTTPYGFDFGISFDGKIWIPYDFVIELHNEYANGSWFRMARITESNNPSERVPVTGAFGTTQLAFLRSQSSFEVAQLPQGENFLFGAVYDESLSLTIQTTAQRLNSGIRNNYDLITATDTGASASLVTSMAALFSWSGTNGTHVHAIPDAADMDGAILEFTTDESFTGAKTVEVTPATGNIRGASTFEITAANTKYQFRAMGGNWY